MKQFLLLILLIPALFVLQTGRAQVGNTAAETLKKLNMQGAYPWKPGLENNSQPLLFMENKGQVADANGNPRADILFAAGNKGAKVYITGTALYYQFTRLEYPKGFDMQKLANLKDAKKRQAIERQIKRTTHRFGMQLQGANPHPAVHTEGQSEYTENYYMAHCPQGITGVHGYEKIVFENVYKGIDWVIYNNDGLMEYDFLVHAGADPKSIKLKIEDADSYTINAKGELQLKSRLGEITEKAPESFDEQGRSIATSFTKSADGSIGFTVNAIVNQTLRIDPAIAWATYYGGTGDDYGNSTAMDTSGNVYLAGTTSSTTTIAAGGFHGAIGGSVDAFLVKFSSTGARLWATYYGGASDDYGVSCAVDSSANVYLAGYTYSNSGIASGGFKNAFGGFLDAFLVKFNSSGARVWGTYYGGTAEDQATSCTVDDAGNVYLVGYTASTTGIASGGFQNTMGGGYWDGFLVEFNAAGNRVLATYYGGNGDDYGSACAVDKGGHIFIAGYTSSTSGVASGGFQNTFAAGGFYDAFLIKLSTSGNRLWSTYYGGGGNDYGNSCAIDGGGNIYLAGYTNSTSGIASGGFKITPGGDFDAFLTKFNTSGGRIWATYYGDIGVEYGNYCVTDAGNNVYLVGNTTSASGIASAGFRINYAGNTDVFVAKFGTAGARVWASYYGGPNADYGNAVIVKGSDSLYVAGYTASTTGIASGGFKNAYGGGSYDAFLLKTSSKCTPAISITVTPASNICQNSKATFTATGSSGGSTPAYQWKKNNANVGTSTFSYIDSTLKNGDSVWVVMTSNAACATTPTATSNKLKPTVAARVTPAVTVAANPATATCPGTKVAFTATPANGGTTPAYQWKKNNANVGTNLNNYADSLLKNNDSVWVVLTSNASCVTAVTATSAKIKVAVNAAIAKPVITTSRSPKLCLFDSVVLSTTSPGNWQWQRNGKDIAGAIKASYVAYIAGTYKLRVTTAAGCTNLSDSLVVTVANDTKPVITLRNDTLISSAAAGNQWFYNLNTIGGATNVAYKPQNMGYYSVQTTVSGCKSPMSDLFVYTANTLKAKSGTLAASIQPNPAGSYTTLSIRNSNGPAQVTIMDVAGKTLWVSGKTSSSQIRIPVSNLAQGNYIVMVQNNTRGVMVKLLVQR